MYVDSERHIYWFSLRLWCKPGFYYDISLILQDIFPKKWVVLIVYYIWHIGFIESYYFLCVTIELIYRNMFILIRKLIIMAFLNVQNILFYN